MRVTKKGNVKLEADEVRVGNFFVKREDEHIKIQDINAIFSHRVNRRMPIGVWLENMWERAHHGGDGDRDAATRTLHAYIATMWSFFSVAPDDEFVNDALSVSRAALERHPEWYGVKRDATPEEDAEAAKEVREMKEFEEEVRAVKEREEAEDGRGE